MQCIASMALRKAFASLLDVELSLKSTSVIMGLYGDVNVYTNSSIEESSLVMAFRAL